MATSRFEFPSDLTQIKKASSTVMDYLDDLRMDESTLFDIKLCFEEALINAIKYGNRKDTSLVIHVEVEKNQDYVRVSVCDQGSGFDFEHCEDPTVEENVERTRGRGVFLIKKLMDEVSYDKNGSCVHMIKKIK